MAIKYSLTVPSVRFVARKQAGNWSRGACKAFVHALSGELQYVWCIHLGMELDYTCCFAVCVCTLHASLPLHCCVNVCALRADVDTVHGLHASLPLHCCINVCALRADVDTVHGLPACLPRLTRTITITCS